MKKIFRQLVVFLLLFMLALPVQAAWADTEQPSSPQPLILITEIQTGGLINEAEAPKAEFVELYNASPEPADLTGWQLDFLTKGHDGESPPTRVLATLEGVLDSGAFWLVSYEDYLEVADFYFSGGPSRGYLPKGDGTVRLLDGGGAVADLVGYGSPNNYLDQPASAPPSGQSLQRCFDDGMPVSTGNNHADFKVYTVSSPGSGLDCPQAEQATYNSCEGLNISEIGANLASEKQFIELYNHTAGSIDLTGCRLETNRSTTKRYVFGGLILNANSYIVIYIKDTDLILTKTTSGTVYLLSSDGLVEADSQSYANLKSGTSWAWFGPSDWRQTYSPTPGAFNLWQQFPPCPEGKERNPETNRCRQVEGVATGLNPCRPDQERNPETNRCRKIGTTSVLKPCNPDQERNPETNRCRKIASPTLKPCQPGQERNPATNRCRKVAIASSNALASIRDIEALSKASRLGWWLTGIVLVVAAGYGAWEWRADLRNFVMRLRR